MTAIALGDSHLIDTWDRAAALARPWRELALLESASGIPVDELARLTIGERDRLLLALRIGTFGSRLECETRCPTCDARLELAFDAAQLLTPAVKVDDADLEIVEDDWKVCFRLPDSYDVAAALAGEDLAERLTIGGAIAVPNVARQRVAARVAELDPQADISLDLRCAVCDHRWQAHFDPAAFLFREIEAAVVRLTNEVHQLARAYAWSEESILAMGATRRRRYLGLVAQ